MAAKKTKPVPPPPFEGTLEDLERAHLAEPGWTCFCGKVLSDYGDDRRGNEDRQGPRRTLRLYHRPGGSAREPGAFVAALETQLRGWPPEVVVLVPAHPPESP